MAEASQHDFDLHVLAQLEKLFGDHDLETLVPPPEIIDGLLKFDAAVLLKHRISGKEVMSKKFDSQIQNKICCLLTILLETSSLP